MLSGRRAHVGAVSGGAANSCNPPGVLLLWLMLPLLPCSCQAMRGLPLLHGIGKSPCDSRKLDAQARSCAPP
jgi:hypothetical protein